MMQAPARYRQYLETLTPETLASLPEYVHPDVRFRDPFNDVHGADAMARIFQDMFDNVGDVFFRIHHMTGKGNTCLMAWRFQATLRGKPWEFDGTSVITFAPDDRVAEHIDHWDAAGNFYEHLPIIGWLLRALRRRVAAQ